MWNVILDPRRVIPVVFVVYQFVGTRQKALLCDLYNLWCHCKCSGVTNEAYSYYQQTTHFTWNCPRCIAGCLPFHDCSSLTSKDSLVTHFDDDCASKFAHIKEKKRSGYARLRTAIAHLNCRSFLSHKDEIVQLICTLHLDVLTL